VCTAVERSDRFRVLPKPRKENGHTGRERSGNSSQGTIRVAAPMSRCYEATLRPYCTHVYCENDHSGQQARDLGPDEVRDVAKKPDDDEENAEALPGL
jgi:hypothetical protein